MNTFPAPPIRTEFPQKGTPSFYSRPWTQWFQQITNQFNAGISNQVPASASAMGTAGDIAFDSNYLYVCVGTNTWKRTALTTW